MEQYRTFLVLGIITFLLLTASYIFSVQSARAPSTVLPLPSHLEYARTPEAQQQGLSNRAEVPADYGMLFVFPAPGQYSFWMKDMMVSIDIVWIRSDGTIVRIDHRLSPDTYPTTYTPSEPVSLVLEMRAGEAKRLGYDVGDRVRLPKDWQK